LIRDFQPDWNYCLTKTLILPSIALGTLAPGVLTKTISEKANTVTMQKQHHYL
jgi:hypothetical protein